MAQTAAHRPTMIGVVLRRCFHIRLVVCALNHNRDRETAGPGLKILELRRARHKTNQLTAFQTLQHSVLDRRHSIRKMFIDNAAAWQKCFVG